MFGKIIRNILRDPILLPVPAFLMKYSVLGRDAEINWTESISSQPHT